MTALFLHSARFTATGDSRAAAPASNVSLDEPGMVWRSPNSDFSAIVIDLGATPSPFDTVGLISNLRPNDRVTIQVNDSNSNWSGATLYASSYVNAAGSVVEGFATKTIHRLPLIRARYVRITITPTDGPHPIGYWEVQRVLVGRAVTTLAIDYDAEQTVVDPSIVDTREGFDIIQEYKSRMRWKFSMSFITGTDWRNIWAAFLTRVGKTKPFLFVPDLEGDIVTEATYGRIRNDAVAKTPGGDVRKVELTIEGLAL